jgi:vacuolar-type H+-ATPase subunit H
MFAKSKNLRGQAQDLAQDLADQVGPHLENAVDAARETLAPRIADAREMAAPHVADARERLRKDVLPTVQSALAEARDQAGPMAEEAKRRGTAAAVALTGDQPKKRGRKRWIALLALGGAAAVAARRLLGSDSGTHAGSPNAYSPPVPNQRTSPLTDVGDDAAGASPEEAIADRADEPHDVTTPADPADTIHVKRD